MRIWDIDPGFLNNQSLLGEHRELHGMVSILVNDKKGYRNHPETKRWEQHLEALIARHELLVEEMNVRNFNHQSPVSANGSEISWPKKFIDTPDIQYQLLQMKYKNKPGGRISMPKNTQELWAKHKYSIMARNYNHYKRFGGEVAVNAVTYTDLSEILVRLLQQPPVTTALKNAVYHMWGYVSKYSANHPDRMGLSELLDEIRRLSLKHSVGYLIESTALGELGYWCRIKNHLAMSETKPLISEQGEKNNVASDLVTG